MVNDTACTIRENSNVEISLHTEKSKQNNMSSDPVEIESL